MRVQACVLYGAAEFSRDMDIALLAEAENLDRLRAALEELDAEVAVVPPFSMEYLQKGHAVHFRCRHPNARGTRRDVMSRMRGVAPFHELWKRRTTVEVAPGDQIDVLELPDLVQAKNQRDKDWPMIRRLIEADMGGTGDRVSTQRALFWLRECRTPKLFRAAALKYPDPAAYASTARPWLLNIASRSDDEIRAALDAEQAREREADRTYWAPLREEPEWMRDARLD